MICNSVKWIGQNAFAVTVSLILRIVCRNSLKILTKFCGTISRSIGAKYVLIVVKLNKNNVSKFIDLAGFASMMKCCCCFMRLSFCLSYSLFFLLHLIYVFVSKMHKMRSLSRTLSLFLSRLKFQQLKSITMYSLLFLFNSSSSSSSVCSLFSFLFVVFSIT